MIKNEERHADAAKYDINDCSGNRYSLFLSRSFMNCSIFFGSQKRQEAVKIASFHVKSNGLWVFETSLRLANKTINAQLSSKEPVNIAYCGLTGILHLSDTEYANIEIKILEKFKSYLILVKDSHNSWNVQLYACRNGSKLTVSVHQNAELIVSAPSKEDGWLEELKSFFGFVRYHWGDVIGSKLQLDVPTPENIACLFCIGLHNSIVGTQIMTDSPTG